MVSWQQLLPHHSGSFVSDQGTKNTSSSSAASISNHKGSGVPQPPQFLCSAKHSLPLFLLPGEWVRRDSYRSLLQFPLSVRLQYVHFCGFASLLGLRGLFSAYCSAFTLVGFFVTCIYPHRHDEPLRAIPPRTLQTIFFRV